MKLMMLAIDEEAPIEIREKLAFIGTKKMDITDALLEHGVSEVVILATCHRNEIYLSYSSKFDIDARKVAHWVASALGEKEQWTMFTSLHGEEVIHHLFEVTAGLKSVVIGEDQILGQVKQALDESNEFGSSGKVLHTLFREAITTAKKIKTETHISEYPLSLSYIGIQILLEELKNKPQPSVLIVGIGQMGQLALRYLHEENFEHIYVTNHHFEKIKALNEADPRFIPIPYEERYAMLDKVDAVISATSSPHTILKAEHIPDDCHLVMIDLAMPRDIDEEVRRYPNVKLFNMDDFMKMRDQNSQKREAFAREAQRYIHQGVADFLNWQHQSRVDPAIALLNRQVETIHRDVMQYLTRKINVSQRDLKLIDKMCHSALKRIIRQPILNLKQANDEQQEEYIRVIEQLFDKGEDKSC